MCSGVHYTTKVGQCSYIWITLKGHLQSVENIRRCHPMGQRCSQTSHSLIIDYITGWELVCLCDERGTQTTWFSPTNDITENQKLRRNGLWRKKIEKMRSSGLCPVRRWKRPPEAWTRDECSLKMASGWGRHDGGIQTFARLRMIAYRGKEHMWRCSEISGTRCVISSFALFWHSHFSLPG